MKNLLKKISMISCSLILSITMVATTSSASFAIPSSAAWSPWVVKSKAAAGTSYGDWKTGVSGRGGKGVTLSLSQARSVSNTLTGTIKANKSNVDASLGYTTSKSFTRSGSYSISAPNKKKTYTIKYRNVYKRTKLNQERCFMINGKIVDTEKVVGYGNKFSHFDYTWTAK